MKDLKLDRLLCEADLDRAELVPLLGELATKPIGERVPFLGHLPRALSHADPALRVAALGALAGADGRLAFARMVEALADPVIEVQRAAVEALRISSAAQPARFAHALYHPAPEVRRAAIAGAWPNGAAAFTFALLADPACAPELVRRLDHAARGEGAAEAPAVDLSALPALFDFVAQGLLPAAIARRLVAEVPWSDAVRWLAVAVQRPPEAVAKILARAASEPPESSDADVLDDLLALFWDEADATQSAFFRRLAAAMLSFPRALRDRVVAALVIAGARRGFLPEAATAIAAPFHPPLFGAAWIPREARLAAVRVLHGARSNTPRLPDHEVEALLRLDLCRREDGKLDLWVVVGFLQLVENHPIHCLLRWVGEDAVIEAFLADVERGLPLLALRDDSKRGRAHLLDRVTRAAGFRRAEVLALLVVATPRDRLDFLDPLDAGEGAALLIALFSLLRRMGADLPKKAPAMAALIDRIAAHEPQVRAVLDALLDAEAPGHLAFAMQVLGAFGVMLAGPDFVRIALSLSVPRIRALCAALPACSTFPFGKEMALAHALSAHPDDEVRAWAIARLPPTEAELPVTRAHAAPAAARRLTVAEIDAVVCASDADLPVAVEPALVEPTAGLCEALARRRPPIAPDVKVCTAILGSHDPMEQADTELGRFGSSAAPFLSALDKEMVRVWERELCLPPIAHAFLHCWERHAFAMMEAFLADGGLGAQLSRAAALTQAVLRTSVWEAAASVLSMWRWRDREALAKVASAALGAQLVAALDTELGESAARMLVSIAAARVDVAMIDALRPSIQDKLPDLTPTVRGLLAAIVDARGLTGSGAVRAASTHRRDESVVDQVRRSADLDELERFCRSDVPYVVEEAAIRLCELGELGCARILAVIRSGPLAPAPLYASVSLWPEGPSLTEARLAALRDDESPELRFRFAVALTERGERAFLDHAITAACVEVAEPWLTAADWTRLLGFGFDERSLSIALASSPHPHAYRRAIEHLVAVPREEATPAILGALAAFLEAGTTRLLALRYDAARRLFREGDTRGYPILFAAMTLPAIRRDLGPTLLRDGAPDRVEAAPLSALLAGLRGSYESIAATLLLGAPPSDVRSRALELMLAESTTPAARAEVAAHVRSGHRSEKLRALAEAFAWGIRTGRSLTGRLYRIEMTFGATLGYTRLDEDRVFVSPLPILRRDPHGREIVEGLVLHELGHHLHHRGKEEAAIWKKAQSEGLHGLLNTVADEHLERRLRAVDASYGDRLKRLGAHAFQHASKDVRVVDLLASLGARAFAVLTSIPLEVARSAGAVRVTSGAILIEMERGGLSFSRFFRALRLGLGDRHGDPRVREGLALCKGLRKRTMGELLDLARRLRALFGWETQLVEHLGTHEGLESAEAEGAVHGDGITKEELEREIQRVLDPERARRDATGKPPTESRAWINVNPDERFEQIRNVVKVPRDPEAHARYAREVTLAAQRMRRFLSGLGITLEPERFRLHGRRFDRTRALPMVTRGDPRVLIAREPRVRTDLFLAVLVDCSGSMATRRNIEKAKLFATMLAEAARGLRGIDLHVYGFDDRTMFDAGDADHCAAHGLAAGAGNNDAGALFYAANAARRSRRRAKLLVMISDGLPTECSVSALRALVTRLGSRYGICCAQVAVQPLAEVCFPNYVVLEESDPAPAVARFGGVVAELVRRAIAIA